MAFGGRFFRVLAQEKAPYLITILFASIGWSITYTVGRIVDSPTVEYSTRASVAGRRFQVDLRNVTRKQSFPNVTINVRLNGGSDLVMGEPALAADAPGWPGRMPISADYTHQTADFTIANMQPGWTIHIVVPYRGKAEPRFHLVDAQATLRLVPSSLETFVVEHELSLLILLMALYVGVIVTVVARYSPDPEPVRDPYTGFE